mgnify:CR=1 FL=1
MRWIGRATACLVAASIGLGHGTANAATTTYWSTGTQMPNWGSIGVSSAGFVTHTGHGIGTKSTSSPLWTHYTAIWTTGGTPIHILNSNAAAQSSVYPGEASTRAGCSNQSGGIRTAKCQESRP